MVKQHHDSRGKFVKQSEQQHWKLVPVEAMSSEGEESDQGAIFHHAPMWRSDDIVFHC